MKKKLINNLGKLGIDKSCLPEVLNNKTIYALIQRKRTEYRDHSDNLMTLLELIADDADTVSTIAGLNI